MIERISFFNLHSGQVMKMIFRIFFRKEEFVWAGVVDCLFSYEFWFDVCVSRSFPLLVERSDRDEDEDVDEMTYVVRTFYFFYFNHSHDSVNVFFKQFSHG